MACVPLNSSGPRTISALRMSMRRLRCVVCRRRDAVALCDHELGPDELVLAGQRTCDAPLCRRCRNPGPQHGTDYCNLHVTEGAQLALL